MVITEIELRELWQNGRQPLPAFPPGTRFSPAAQDFIKDHRLEIRYAEPATTPPAAALLPSVGSTLLQPPASNLSLSATLDALHALALLVAAEARRYQLPALARRLDALAADCLASASPSLPVIATAQLPVTNYQFPLPTDHAILHWLNYLRASARQAAALAQALGQAQQAAALEQVSAAAADLGQRVRSGELGWNSPMV